MVSYQGFIRTVCVSYLSPKHHVLTILNSYTGERTADAIIDFINTQTGICDNLKKYLVIINQDYIRVGCKCGRWTK